MACVRSLPPRFGARRGRSGLTRPPCCVGLLDQTAFFCTKGGEAILWPERAGRPAIGPSLRLFDSTCPRSRDAVRHGLPLHAQEAEAPAGAGMAARNGEGTRFRAVEGSAGGFPFWRAAASAGRAGLCLSLRNTCGAEHKKGSRRSLFKPYFLGWQGLQPLKVSFRAGLSAAAFWWQPIQDFSDFLLWAI